MGKKDTFSGPILTIRLSDGLALQNRLPLDNVIRVLQEMKAMIEETGRHLAKQTGYDGPAFGLELIGGFARGSVVANLAITKNPSTGVQAVIEIMDTVKFLRASAPPILPTPPVAAMHKRAGKMQPEAAVVRRLNNIAKVQEITGTKLDLTLRTSERKRFKAVFDEVAALSAAGYRKAKLVIENTVLYGRLSELRDDSESEELEPSSTVFARLKCDDTQDWTLAFPQKEAEAVARLWTKQVVVFGDAHYFAARGPRLDATRIDADEHRDYVMAFDELSGSMPNLGEGSIDELLDRAGR